MVATGPSPRNLPSIIKEHRVPSFSDTLEKAIHSALAQANTHRHELATLEHLLLALIDEPDAAKVMNACGVDLDILRATLVEFIEDELSTLVTDVEGSEAVPTAAFQRVIQRVAFPFIYRLIREDGVDLLAISRNKQVFRCNDR